MPTRPKSQRPDVQSKSASMYQGMNLDDLILKTVIWQDEHGAD